MFGSPILDVAIGMVMIYLLLSLIASAVQEILAAVIQARAANLLRGLLSLFSGDHISADTSFVHALFNHGLVRGLYTVPSKDYKEVEPSAWRRYSGMFRLWLQRLFAVAPPPGATKTLGVESLLLPSYIPSRVVALALRDLLSTTPAPVDPALEGAVHDLKVELTDPITGKPLSDDAIRLKNIATNLDRLVKNPDGTINLAAQALRALVQDAAGSSRRLQENFEGWYNDGMDRVSGWYKRHVQNVLLCIGVLLAIAFNVDSVRVATTLWLDKDARVGLAQASQQYLQQHPDRPAKPGEVTAAPAPASENGDAAGPSSVKVKELQGNLQATVDSFNAVAKSSLLPVGWKYRPADYRLFWSAYVGHPTWHVSFGILSTLLGWLITAVALSLGAPFWFDMLNKFMVVRNTVKPQEKSKDEPSKS